MATKAEKQARRQQRIKQLLTAQHHMARGVCPDCGVHNEPQSEESRILPTYERGDYVKVEFAGDAGMLSEWMWVCVASCDDAKRIVFGTLDNAPVNDATGKLKVGTELAVSYSQIREHRKASTF